jgi:RNA polymerase sigma factor for flagellar operon FliA
MESLDFSSDAHHKTDSSSAINNPYDQMRRRQLRDKVRQALQTLPERERMILHLYYFEEITMRKIGDLLGLSESRICQIHRNACQKLKDILGFDHSELSDIF